MIKKEHTIEIKKDTSKSFIFLLGCIIGAIGFVTIYGVKVLDVTYDAWLMTGGDLSQHYIGWQFFRQSEWHFPIGLIDGLIYPEKVSIMYMDSIPIFAIFFKVFAPILPSTFQYFGIWGIISFALQGGIASLIIRKFTPNALICAIGSIFFIISPTMIQRMFGHTALAGHWIILLTIYVYLSKTYFNDLKRNIIIWCILASLSVTVHIYFLPMVMIMLSCYLLRDYLENKDIKRISIIFICPILSTLFVMFIIGAFWGSSEFNAVGLGEYSANINALLNSQGFSNYLMKLPTVTKDQVEGFAYLGLGVIILLIFSIYFKIEALFPMNKEKIIEYIKGNLSQFTLFICMIIFFVLALSPKITLNSNVLFTIPYHKVIIKLLSIFRASGRFMWPICYLLTIYVIKTILCKSSKKQANILLCVCVIIQMSDLSNIVVNKNNYFSQNIQHISKLQSNVWEKISDENYKHIVFVQGIQNISMESTLFWDISVYAVKNNITLNDGFVARRDLKVANSYKNEYLHELQNGTSRDDTIYVFGDIKSIYTLCLSNYPLIYYNIDGMVIGVSKVIPEVKESKEEIEEIINRGINILPRNNEYLQSGKDDDNGRILNSRGISYGPYAHLEKGSYKLVVTGENLKQCNYDVSYHGGQDNVKVEELQKDNDRIVLTFELEKNLEDVEFRIHNMNQENVVLKEMLINRQIN